MDAPSPTAGVSSTPPAPQARPEATPTTAALLALALGLLGWHAWEAQRWGSRPTDPDPDAASRIDLNHADRAQLLQLPGVGDITAQRIEEYRAAHNGFQTVEELRKVHGVGPALLERLRPLVAVEPYEPVGDETDVPPPAAPPTPDLRKRAPPKNVQPIVLKLDAGKKKGEDLTAPINVNRATAEELQRLPGVGPALSGRIIQVRDRQPFRSVEELRRVPGIGPKTLEHLRPFVVVNDGQAQP
jgi:competence protein ComEA